MIVKRSTREEKMASIDKVLKCGCKFRVILDLSGGSVSAGNIYSKCQKHSGMKDHQIRNENLRDLFKERPKGRE